MLQLTCSAAAPACVQSAKPPPPTRHLLGVTSAQNPWDGIAAKGCTRSTAHQLDAGGAKLPARVRMRRGAGRGVAVVRPTRGAPKLTRPLSLDCLVQVRFRCLPAEGRRRFQRQGQQRWDGTHQLAIDGKPGLGLERFVTLLCKAGANTQLT